MLLKLSSLSANLALDSSIARCRDLGVRGSSKSSQRDCPSFAAGFVDSFAGVFANDDTLELDARLGERSTGWAIPWGAFLVESVGEVV